MIPAYGVAMKDLALRGNARDVYLWCYEHLDVVTYRAVKLSAIEVALRMDDSTVARALVLLVERGYLERGDRTDRLWTYRLYHSRQCQPAA